MDINLTMNNAVPPHSKRVLKESGLGERLKTARGTLRLTERDAAQRLHLNPNIISLIENEDFENGPPPTFMRGYIRSYARLLNFPDEEINAAFIQLETHSVQYQTTDPKLVIAKTSPSHQSHHYIRRGSYLIGAVLVGLVVLWWGSHPKDVIPKQANLSESLAVPPGPPPVNVAPALPPSVAPVAAAPQVQQLKATPATPIPTKTAPPTLTTTPPIVSVSPPASAPKILKPTETVSDEQSDDVSDNSIYN